MNYAFVEMTYINGDVQWDVWEARINELAAAGWIIREIITPGTQGRAAALMQREAPAKPGQP